jgi:phosphoglycolate phosphatase
LKTLFFDLDGTITDPAAGILRSVQHALKTLSLPVPPPAELSWVIGPPLRKSFPRLGVAQADVERCLSAYRDCYLAGGLYEATLYDGILETLGVLHGRGHSMMVVTAKPHLYAKPIVSHFGALGFFQEVYGPELDGRNDHKGDLIREILQARNLAPQDAVMIGDRANDILSAAENDVPSVGVLWGYGDAQELKDAGAPLLVERPGQLLDLDWS